MRKKIICTVAAVAVVAGLLIAVNSARKFETAAASARRATIENDATSDEPAIEAAVSTTETTTVTEPATSTAASKTAKATTAESPTVGRLKTAELHQYFSRNRPMLERISAWLLEEFKPQKMESIYIDPIGIHYYYGGFQVENETEPSEFLDFRQKAEQETGNICDIRITLQEGKRAVTFLFYQLNQDASIVYLPDGFVDFSIPYDSYDISFTHIEGNWYSWYI